MESSILSITTGRENLTTGSDIEIHAFHVDHPDCPIKLYNNGGAGSYQANTFLNKLAHKKLERQDKQNETLYLVSPSQMLPFKNPANRAVGGNSQNRGWTKNEYSVPDETIIKLDIKRKSKTTRFGDITNWGRALVYLRVKNSGPLVNLEFSGADENFGIIAQGRFYILNFEQVQARSIVTHPSDKAYAGPRAFNLLLSKKILEEARKANVTLENDTVLLDGEEIKIKRLRKKSTISSIM